MSDCLHGLSYFGFFACLFALRDVSGLTLAVQSLVQTREEKLLDQREIRE